MGDVIPTNDPTLNDIQLLRAMNALSASIAALTIAVIELTSATPNEAKQKIVLELLEVKDKLTLADQLQTQIMDRYDAEA